MAPCCQPVCPYERVKGGGGVGGLAKEGKKSVFKLEKRDLMTE